MKAKLIYTRRIQLFLHCEDKEKLAEGYKTLYSWQQGCCKAANTITTHLFVQDHLKQLFYLTEDVQVKLADRKKDEKGILTTSPMNTTYQVLAKQWKGSIPMHIMSCLNRSITRQYHAKREACISGGQALHTYGRHLPIPFKSTDMRQWQPTPGGDNFTFRLFTLSFRTYFGRDAGEKKALVAKALNGEIKWCSSAIQLKKGKIFLLAAFEFPPGAHDLDDSILAEASLSVDNPVQVIIGNRRYTIGNKEEFLYRRLAIQSARRRVQAAAAFHKGGHGHHRKLKALDRFSEKEKRYVDTKLHQYSRRLIDLCIRHRAGALLLTGQQQKEETAKEDSFLLRNWSYHDFKNKIAYKARAAGITVIEE